jgi:nucleoside-diphosphate-sugar epimerase
VDNPFILISGSSGFLGSYICKFLVKSCINYCSIGRSNSDILCDLSVNVPRFSKKFDVVIHAAGKAHSIPKSQIEQDEFFDINVCGTLNLLKGLEDSRAIPKYFIYISSVSVYGKDDGINISENEPLLAKDPYGLSKIEAENLITNWCMERNVICTIFRLPLVVGENPPGNLNSMINAIKKGFYFNIDGGVAKKSMVLASDVAKYLLIAAKVGGIYNLTDGLHPSFHDLSKTISKSIGKISVPNMPHFIAIFLGKIGDITGDSLPINSNTISKIRSTLTFDDSKARLAFGWKPASVLDGFKFKPNVK